MVEKPLDISFNPEKAELDPLEELEAHQAKLKAATEKNSSYFKIKQQQPHHRYDESQSTTSDPNVHLKRFLKKWSSWIVDFHWVFTLKYLIETLPTNKLLQFIKNYPILDNFIVHWMWWLYSMSKDMEEITKDAFSGIGSMPWLLSDVRKSAESSSMANFPGNLMNGRKSQTRSSSTNFGCNANGHSGYKSAFQENQQNKKMRENHYHSPWLQHNNNNNSNNKNSFNNQNKTYARNGQQFQARKRPIRHSVSITIFCLLNKKAKEDVDLVEYKNKTYSTIDLKRSVSFSSLQRNKETDDFKSICASLRQTALDLNAKITKYDEEEASENISCTMARGVADTKDETTSESLFMSRDDDDVSALENTVVDAYQEDLNTEIENIAQHVVLILEEERVEIKSDEQELVYETDEIVSFE